MAGLCSELEGLFSSGIQVTQSLAEFYTASHKHQDVRIAQLVDDLAVLLRTLIQLDSVAKHRGSRQAGAGVNSIVETGIERCRRVVYELYDEWEKFTVSGSTGKSRGCPCLINGLLTAYPFRPSTLQKLDEDIREIRSVLALLVGHLQMTDAQDIQVVDEIKALADSVQPSRIAMSLQLWLSAPPETISNHQTACAKRQPGTGLWFLEGRSFSTWLNGNNSFLWLNGISGSGKTVLCSSAILHAFWHKRSDPYSAVAYFYFNPSSCNVSNHDDAAMLRGLILQLANQLEVEDEGLVFLCNRHIAPSTSALLDHLRELVSKFNQTWILLDGLDESHSNEPRARVLSVIGTMRNWALPGLHVLVTSRDQPDIRDSLKASADEQVNMSGRMIDFDIARFIAGKLEADPKLRKWLPHRDQIQIALVERAKGEFRWVECQLESLQHCPGSMDDLERFLDKLPHTIHETYSATLLRSINAGATARDALRVLNLLSYAPSRPLALGQLIDAVAVDLTTTPGHLDRSHRFHSFDDIQNLCPGMVDFTVHESIHHPPILGVRIAHHSVQEYLESKDSFFVASDEISAQTEMLHIFLTYLSDPIFAQDCASFATDDFDKDYRVDLKYPLARYAAEHWLSCYRSISGNVTSPETRPLVLSFFKNPDVFQNWLSIYNPDATPTRFQDGSRDYSDGFPSPVYYASLLGLDEILVELLQFPIGGASSWTYINEALLNQDLRGHHGGPLHAAAAEGHLSTVKILVEAGASIDLEAFSSGTPLNIASLFGHSEVVKYLLDAGARVNGPSGDYYGPALTAAAYSGDEKIVKMLLDSGADVHACGGQYGTALGAAASAPSTGSRTKMVQLLLDAGADVNAATGDCGSVLQAAAFAIGDDETVRLLLDAGGNVNSSGGNGGSPLQAAAAHGGAERTKVRMLLEAGADPNVQGGVFGSALQAAAHNKRGNEILPMLLDAGADVNATGGAYGSALQAAAGRGNDKSIRILLAAGADVSSQNKHGSALWVASENGCEEVIQTLLDAGADVNSSNGRFGSALKVAMKRRHTKVVEILKARGARED